MTPPSAADAANATALLWIEVTFYVAYFLGLAFFVTFQRMKHLRWDFREGEERAQSRVWRFSHT